MSWANISKLNIPINIKTVSENKSNKKIIITKKEVIQETDEDFFDFFVGPDLFDGIIDVKMNCEKYTPFIFEKASSSDIYFFFYKYIDFYNSLPNKIINRFLIDTGYDSSDNIDNF